jgi:hypothetical protein
MGLPCAIKGVKTDARRSRRFCVERARMGVVNRSKIKVGKRTAGGYFVIIFPNIFRAPGKFATNEHE